MFVKTKRQYWATTLICVLLMALLIGCTGGEGKTTPTVGSIKDQPPSGKTGATATPPPAEGPGVTITFACYDWEFGDFEKMVEEFQELNPDIKVQLVSIQEALGIELGDDWPEDSSAKLAAAADTMGANYFQNQDLQAGLLHDLWPFIEADRTFDQDDFYPGTLEAYRSDSGLWAIPVNASLQLIQYNKDIFDEAGVDYPQPDWTWDDFLDKAKQLTLRTGDEVARYGFVDVSGNTLALGAIISQVEWLVDEAVDPPMPHLDRAEVAEAVQWYADLVLEYGVMPPPPEGPEDYMELYALTEDKAAMSIGGGIVIMGLEQERNVGQAPLPQGKTAVNPMWVQGYAMSAGTQYPDESWRWLVFLSRRYSSGLVEMGGMLPARRSVAEEAGFWDNLPEDQVAAYQAALEHPFPMNQTPEVWGALAEAIQAVVTGESDVQTALADAQAKAEEALAGATKPAEEVTPIVVATPKPEPEPGEGELISFAVLSVDLSHYRQLADEFHEQHPEISVKVTQPSLAGGSFDLASLLQVADCATGYADLYDPEIRALLLSLQPFLESGEGLPLEDFYPQALSAFRWEGELWGLPAEGTTQIMFYNKTLFEAANVPYPRPGWTVEDFVQAAQALTVGQGDEKQYGFVSYIETTDFEFLIGQQGVKLIDYDTDPPTIHFDDPATIEAVQWYADLGLVHEVMPSLPLNAYQPDIAGYQERMSLISSGRAAMWTLYGNMMGMGLSALFPDDFEFGFAPLPLAPQGGGYRQIYFSGYFIAADAANPKACWDWLVFLTENPPAQGGLPPRRSVAESEAFRQQVGEEIADVYQFAISHSQELAASPTDERSRIGTSTYWLYTAYDRILAGEDAETALAWAQDMAEAFGACLASREDLEGQESIKTCATQVDPEFPVWVFGQGE
jgi:multiple sugar transport system substrate-binding protein